MGSFSFLFMLWQIVRFGFLFFMFENYVLCFYGSPNYKNLVIFFFFFFFFFFLYEQYMHGYFFLCFARPIPVRVSGNIRLDSCSLGFC